MKLLFCALILLSSTPSLAELSVLGGDSVGPNELIAKRTVALIFLGRNKMSYLCSGSIVDANHVLTARHCVDGYKVKKAYAIFSIGNIYQEFEQAGRKSNHQNILGVSNIDRFDGYPGTKAISDEGIVNSNFTDLAMLELEQNIPIGYEPMHFLPQEKVIQLLNGLGRIWIAGYGDFRYTQNPSDGTGAGYLRKGATNFERLSTQQTNIVFHGFRAGNPCIGDSGGPAMIEDQGDLFQVGVLSGSNCGSYAVHTLVSTEKLELNPSH